MKINKTYFAYPILALFWSIDLCFSIMSAFFVVYYFVMNDNFYIVTAFSFVLFGTAAILSAKHTMEKIKITKESIIYGALCNKTQIYFADIDKIYSNFTKYLKMRTIDIDFHNPVSSGQITLQFSEERVKFLESITGIEVTVYK